MDSFFSGIKKRDRNNFSLYPREQVKGAKTTRASSFTGGPCFLMVKDLYNPLKYLLAVQGLDDVAFCAQQE